MSTIENKTKPGQIKSLLLTGLLTGTLDAVAAIIWNHKPGAATLFKFIASGFFGKTAFTGGIAMVLWGIFFHYLIAMSITAVLFITYPAFIRVLKNNYTTAVVFALLTWLITNLVIVPLSQIGWHPLRLTPALIGFGILIFSIGVPIALTASRFYNKQTFGSAIKKRLLPNEI